MLVNYIVGERTGEIFGQSRYQKMIYELLKDKVSFNIISYRGLKFPIFSLVSKHLLYPRSVKRLVREGVTHIASHEQAHLLKNLGHANSLVTVFDLFPIYILTNKLRREYGWANYLLHRLDVPMWVAGLRKAKKMAAISNFTKSEIVRSLHYPSERVEVTHLGVDEKYRPLRDFEKPSYFEGRVIMYSGTEEYRKNVPTLIKSFYKLKKRIPDVKIVKVGRPGSGVGRNSILRLIDELRLQKDVVFVDYVPEEKLPIFYNSSDLFVFPSIYEGFGFPPLEAMACGIPVISSNAASLPEVVGDAGIMINPHDIDGFADAMYKVLTDDGLRKEMVDRGLKRASLFSWDKTAERTLKIYEGIDKV
jgi:glycosyltransferase involved in cell wall biosynthesis